MSDRAGTDPLDPGQRAELARARAAYRTLIRPARVAAVNGWTVGVFGGLSVAWGALAGGSGVAMGAALVAVGWNELRGVRRLKALDPDGATLLGWNQLLLGALVCAYCLWVIAGAAPDPALREMEEAAGIPADLLRELTRWVYGGVAGVVVIVQGLLARWHFRTRERVLHFLQETDGWMIGLL